MKRNDLIKLLLDKSSDEDNIAIAILTDDGIEVCNFDNLKRYTNGKYFEIDRREEREYTVSFATDVELTLRATSPEDAREKAKKVLGEYHDAGFECAYISEINFVTDEHGNEV